MKKSMIFVLCLLPIELFGQNCCPFYEKYIAIGDAELKKGPEAKFETVINAFNTAMLHCPDSAVKVRTKIVQAFTAIENLKNEAEFQSKRAQEALVQMKNEKQKTEAALRRAGELTIEAQQSYALLYQQQEETREALMQAQIAHAKADSVLKVANKLIEKFYFYDSKYALVKSNRGSDFVPEFTFMNRTGDEVDKLGTWTSAQQFNSFGLAKVTKRSLGSNEAYFLDTTGKRYPLAEKLEDLDDSKTALDLSYMNIDSLPEILFSNLQLEILLLSGNRLKELPKSIGNLKNLKILDVSFNKLDALPSKIGDLHNLKILDLSTNFLVKLPETLSNLEKLQKLILSSNSLESLPENFGKLMNLNWLNLDYNKFLYIPNSICELPCTYIFDDSDNNDVEAFLGVARKQNSCLIVTWYFNRR